MKKVQITISLLSVKDGFLKARYEVFNENTGDNHVVTYENGYPVHPDFNEALQRMGYHLVKITGLEATGSELIITGYQRQNCGDTQLLTVYARLDNHLSACNNIVARFCIGRDEYDSLDLLLEDLSACEREAMAYIETGKRFGQGAFIDIDDTDLYICPNAA